MGHALYTMDHALYIIGNGIGGRSHKHQFAVDDYVFGALNLYLDIINIFMLVLALTGGRNN